MNDSCDPAPKPCRCGHMCTAHEHFNSSMDHCGFPDRWCSRFIRLPWSRKQQAARLLRRFRSVITFIRAHPTLDGGQGIAAASYRDKPYQPDHPAEDQASRDTSQPGTAMTAHPSDPRIGTISAAPDQREAINADKTTWTPVGASGEILESKAGTDADRAVSALYGIHYRSLVRLAALLVGDVSTAEKLVQDSFVALHRASRRLTDSDRALSYLRLSVVNRCRVLSRHTVVANKLAPETVPDTPAAAREQITRLGRSALVSALRSLPPNQREVLVLRYYANLPAAQIASAMGITESAVKNHTARALSSLQAELRSANE